jgi:uncharacterized protein DUF4382
LETFAAQWGLKPQGSVGASGLTGVAKRKEKTMISKKWMTGLLAVALVALASGCGMGSSSSPVVQPQSGSVFVTGMDAPLPSVVSFLVDITGMSVTDANNNTQSVMINTTTIDFARLNGMRTLLDINTIPAGTYVSATVTLANPRIGYLNVTNPQTNPPTPPTISTLDSTSTPQAVLTQSNVMIPLANPLVVTPAAIIGLGFDFNLRKSILLDTNGQITGQVTPVLSLKAITPSDADAYVDEFIAGVVTINAAGNTFTIQGPHGHTFTVNVNDQTEWEGSETINDLTTTSIVDISGTLDRTSGAFLADTVAILSQNSFYAGGLITYVNPPVNTAQSFDLYVRDVLPAGTGFNSGQISTIDLTGTEKYFIYWMHNVFSNPRFSNIFFNSALLVPGQHVSVGGPFVNGTVTVKRVVLRHEGHTGTLVANSVNVGASTFQFNSNGLAGVLFDGPVTVYVTPFTRFSGGLASLNDLSSNPTNPLRVVGLVLKDPISGQPVFVARSVEELPN